MIPVKGRTFVTTVGVSVLVAALVLLLIRYVDRPWASFAFAHLHGIRLFPWLTYIANPVLPVALLGLALAGLAAAFGVQPSRPLKVVLACCLAGLIAFAFKEQLKYAFGRNWPETWIDRNPSWIADGIFSFSPFHGGRGWASFPSGHMAMITAPMAVLWQALPRGRWLWACLVGLVAVGLLGADYHWPSDVVAGTALGWAAGVGARTLVTP